jgi:hypothetical protein
MKLPFWLRLVFWSKRRALLNWIDHSRRHAPQKTMRGEA